MDTLYRTTIDDGETSHEIRARFKPVNNNIRMRLDDLIGPAVRRRGGDSYQPGTAAGTVLVGCTAKLFIDDEEIDVAKELGNLEDYFDVERDKDLQEILLGEIVPQTKNRVLLRRYREVFEEFVPPKNPQGQASTLSDEELDPTE